MPKPDPAPAAPVDDTKPDTGEDELAKWKAMARKHEEQAKANKAAADELAKLKADQATADEAAKTEAQKMADRLAALESDLAKERADKARTEVAAAKGLPAGMSARLTGATREELEADADAMLAAIGTKYAPKAGATPEQTGAGASGEPAEKTPAELAAAVRAAR